SYYLVERPVMEGVFWRSVRAAAPALAALGATVAVVVVGTVAPAVAAAHTVAAPRAALPAAVHDRLESAGAFTTDPVRFLLLGDSVAITLSVGLAAGSVHTYGVQVIDQGVFGCDYDAAPAYSQGQLVTPFTTCLQWRTLYAGDVARTRPDVVGLLLGRWSLTDRVVDGRIVHVGEPAWDAHLVAEYTDVVRSLASRNVRVVLFTVPYFSPPQTAPDGALFPEDRPSRVVAFNRDLARVAAAAGGAVTLVDLNAMLSPHGRFQTVVDGVVARWPDGIHVTPAGGQWLQPRILPTVATLGLEARAGVTR
ncbi:MAG TPA: SGNH hydrolase domain-containing protein, partial [Acidimicrobiales bacterium]|nr:SGNH hydrolase domain-containing protein [Acidimicrobiales bacterium]